MTSSDSAALSLRMDTDAGTDLGLSPDTVEEFLALADKGLIIRADCNAPAVQDDFALDPSRTFKLGKVEA
ncbi:hypothetical protein [Nonomuraea sp. NPDC052265]|uniref:hypothetical protein n=1 Tax=Nonomuraea sp. NPDC052265 TaxID=3364374 RepID=UPI0037CBCDA9